MLCADCKRDLTAKKIEFACPEGKPELRTRAEVDKLIAAGQFPRLSQLICLTCEALACRQCFLKFHRGSSEESKDQDDHHYEVIDDF